MAHIDEVIFLWINGLVGSFPLLDRVVEWVVSDYLVPASLALTLLGLWFVGVERSVREKNQIGVLVALIAMALSSGLVLLINNGALFYHGYFRPRPFVDLDVSLLFYEPTDSSFPANTAAAAFAIAAAVWCINKRAGAALLLLAVVYGLARVYAGVHYPSDIIAGAMIGIVVALLVFKLRGLLGPIPIMIIKAARILCLA